MSQDQYDDLTDEMVKPSTKKKMSVEKFFEQFKTLDPNNIGVWPTSVKVTVYIFILALVLAVGYFLAIKSKLEAIDSARAKEKVLLAEFKDKDSKLRNLQLYQAQLQEMEMKFMQQLEQLPKETEIPGLVEDINLTGVNSGLKFTHIRLEPELKQQFFIEQPIDILATGDYHSFGTFVSSIAALPRIVTLHDWTIEGKADKQKSDVPVVTYALKAKTYRYVGTEEAAAAETKPTGAK